jgi:hypothetical protein
VQYLDRRTPKTIDFGIRADVDHEALDMDRVQ